MPRIPAFSDPKCQAPKHALSTLAIIFGLMSLQIWAADGNPTSLQFSPPQASDAWAPRQETLASPIIRRSARRPVLDPNLEQGYKNYLAGDVEAARLDYETALRSDPISLYALHGLAVIALRQGRARDARYYFDLALGADPKDGLALAASIWPWANADPAAAESRLKNLLQGQPRSAPLNFALGNVYSHQNRWREAQQAYFNAVAADGDNPDYLFNLAVSLEHLGQPELAARHYRLALAAVRILPAAFPKEQAEMRLLALGH